MWVMQIPKAISQVSGMQEPPTSFTLDASRCPLTLSGSSHGAVTLHPWGISPVWSEGCQAVRSGGRASPQRTHNQGLWGSEWNDCGYAGSSEEQANYLTQKGLSPPPSGWGRAHRLMGEAQPLLWTPLSRPRVGGRGNRCCCCGGFSHPVKEGASCTQEGSALWRRHVSNLTKGDWTSTQKSRKKSPETVEVKGPCFRKQDATDGKMSCPTYC